MSIRVRSYDWQILHELADRVAVVARAFDGEVEGHAGCELNHVLGTAAISASEAIWDFYRLVREKEELANE
jgi:hypothetical protein